MENGIQTIKEIREELGVYNKTINNYIKAFDVFIKKDFYIEQPNYFGDFRDYQVVSNEFKNILLSLKEEIKSFERDYYNWKTPKEISKIIDFDIKKVLLFLNKNKHLFLISELRKDREWVIINAIDMKGNVIIENTKIKKISSFIIMKELQIEARYETLQRT